MGGDDGRSGEKMGTVRGQLLDLDRKRGNEEIHTALEVLLHQLHALSSSLRL